MKYAEFLTYVQEHAKIYAGKEGKVSINHIIKNNGLELDGLVIMSKCSSAAPTIYLNSFYEQYLQGRELEEILKEIGETYEDNKDRVSISEDYFVHFENVKKTIVYKVINYEQNKKLLESVPHKKILDLAIVFYCLLDQGNEGCATALIYNNHMNIWSVTTEELYELAAVNTPKLLKSNIMKMADIIKELFAQGNQCIGQEEFEKDADSSREMFVLTNANKMNGAGCILYDDVLDQFAKTIKSDLYILPSSIHEVIIIPKNSSLCKKDLIDMVKEVNLEGVSQDEVLSDNVYIYCRSDKSLTL